MSIVKISLLVLLACASAATSALARDTFHNLPGVREPQADGSAGSLNDGFDCSQQLRMRRFHGDSFDRWGDSGVVYSCNRNGVRVESRDSPTRRGWLPGQRQYGWPWAE